MLLLSVYNIEQNRLMVIIRDIGCICQDLYGIMTKKEILGVRNRGRIQNVPSDEVDDLPISPKSLPVLQNGF
jgi:hypothetical protein